MLRAITIDPEIQGGTPCVAGTRVPVKALFDALAHRRSLEYFLEQLSTVSRVQAAEVLPQAGQFISSPPQRPQAAWTYGWMRIFRMNFGASSPRMTDSHWNRCAGMASKMANFWSTPQQRGSM